MTYLVDANVLSEPTKPMPNARVVEWLTDHESDLVVDSIILGELLVGIFSLPRGRKREKLEQWLEDVVRKLKCFPWDAIISSRWAELVVELRSRGEAMPLLDGMIAATALAYDLTLATHNTRDFAKARVKVVDPFIPIPS